MSDEKPRLKRDWEGRSVRVLREIQTRGGRIFAPGAIMVVDRNFGGLSLHKRDVCPHCKCGQDHRVVKVHESDVELLPKEG